MRDQAIRYEILANDGVYADRRKALAIEGGLGLQAMPLYFAEVPLKTADQAKLFRVSGDALGDRLAAQLIEPPFVGSKPEDLKLGVAHLPVHWEEMRTLKERFPQLRFKTDGEVFRGASPRSLFVGTQPAQVPSAYPELERFSLKMHLSADSYARIQGLNGHRDINANDALLATVISQVVEENRDALSPYFDYQPESRAMVARIGEGAQATEVGVIFRELSDRPLIPGFALFSRTSEPLPHRPLQAVGADPQRPLAAQAIDFAVQKQGIDRQAAFLQLFVDPLCDVMFSLMRQGLSAELHPQNFLLEFDAATGATKKVVVRDLHGMGCDDAWRAHHGMPPLFAPERFTDTFPALTQADIDGYFQREGQIRDRYKAPEMFRKMVDFFGGMFFYQLLGAMHDAGELSRAQVDELVARIGERLGHFARAHGIDLDDLENHRIPHVSIWRAFAENIRSKAVFRPDPSLQLKRQRSSSDEDSDSDLPPATRVRAA